MRWHAVKEYGGGTVRGPTKHHDQVAQKIADALAEEHGGGLAGVVILLQEHGSTRRFLIDSNGNAREDVG